MLTTDPKWQLRAAWLWLLAATLFRMAYAGGFPLVPDEANYWQWGRHLAWGYHDQAPLIGWAIRLATEIFGTSEWSVRLPSILAIAATSAYLVVIAARWYGPSAALATALLTQSILLFNVGGLLATPDGLQAAGWAGAAYHVARGYEDNRWRDWLLAGTWFGFGLLAKFTMVLFLPCAYLYGLCSNAHRQRLSGLRPYAGVLLGLAMFLPVIHWNAANGWSSVRHVAHIGGAGEQWSFRLNFLGDFLASQAALLSPVVFVLILLAWSLTHPRSAARTQWVDRYLFFTSFPMIAFFALLTLHSRVYGNWPGAGYLAAAVLVAGWFGRRDANPAPGRMAWGRRLWPWALATAYLMSVLVLLQAVRPFLPIPVQWDRTASEIRGWDHLGATVGKIRNQMPDPQSAFIFGLSYQMASELAFYVPGQPQTVAINRWSRPNVYDYWWDEKALLGRDAVGVTYDGTSHLSRLNQVFDRVEPPVAVPIYWPATRSDRSPLKVYFVYRCHGFRGGLAWQPPDTSDIRVR
jgi:4-amino-4-deoxy-L-arabinose transferase-like glycosyltransferase